MTRTRAIDLVAKAFAGGLFLVTLVASAFALLDGVTTEEIVIGVLSLYLTGTLAVGVFRDLTENPRWRIAFFGGFVAWAGYDYATGGGTLALLLLVVGVFMVVSSVMEYRQ